MKPKCTFERHLMLKGVAMPPGSEWTIQSPGWSFVHVTHGVGYWLHPRVNHELMTGSVLVFLDGGRGEIRASQVGEVLIHFFRVQPERLMGLVTLGGQKSLLQA